MARSLLEACHPSLSGLGSFKLLPALHNVSSCPVDLEPWIPTLNGKNVDKNALSMLNVATEALNLAKEISSITPASVVLTMIKVGSFLVVRVGRSQADRSI